MRPVTWIGHRRINCTRHPDPCLVWPVRVRRDAFGTERPRRDLFLSPDHAVFVDGVLIPIKHLINGGTIEQVATSDVTYYHVELQAHDVLFAEGLPAESYLDTGNRSMFANGGGILTLHPAFDSPKTWHNDAAAPLAVDEARVRPVWERLAARSAALGQPLPKPKFSDDPALHLRTDRRTIRPLFTEQNRFMFVVPEHDGPLYLTSRSGHPTDASSLGWRPAAPRCLRVAHRLDRQRSSPA